MKILHISCFDWMGGAGKAANRLHNELKKYGLDSHMLVDVKECLEDDSIHSISGLTGFASRVYYHVRGQIDQWPLRKYTDRSSLPWALGRINRHVERQISKINPDIVHIHWISAMASLRELAHLSYPTVWTMHDNNLATGGCCYSGDCIRYMDECGRCPQLHSDFSDDLSNVLYKDKKKIFNDSKITFVTLSNWQRDIAKSSSILENCNILKIANGVDVSSFQPQNQFDARKELNLPQNKKIIVFGAEAINNPLKGKDVLIEALNLLEKQFDNEEWPILVTFGRISDVDSFNIGLQIINLGYLDIENLAKLYAAADVAVVPSLEDNCPQVPQEAQACGCPVVCFKGTGVAELIKDGKSGYSVEYGSPVELCTGIMDGLNCSAEMRQAACEHIKNNYDIDIVVQKYIKLYKEKMSE